VARVRESSRSYLPGATATSAGGIVLRRHDGVTEIVLGQRRRERDSATWSLPKGTPNAHETLEQTAVREVNEETGLEVRILAPIGPISYDFVQRGTRIRKTVHFYLMESIGGDLALHDHEFHHVRWVPVSEADTIMSFPTERELVGRALTLANSR
jgi:8-oxo-dGTP pyrophosphatase MutT (NUDIX family)